MSLLRSERGDAMILISIVITGLVVLVSTVALENLRKSMAVQGLQEKSLENLYKAEEGIEYSLYVNKEKSNKNLNFNEQGTTIASNKASYNLTFWEGTNAKKTDAEALTELSKETVGKKIVLVSQSAKSNTNDNANLKRTLFANLPSRYYDQISMGNTLSECQECQSSQDDSDIKTGKKSEIILKTSNPYSGVTDASKISYRLTINCGGFQKCQIQDLKVGVDCGDAFNTSSYSCPASDSAGRSVRCDRNFSVPFSNGKNVMEGYGSLKSSRFKLPSGINMRGKNIVVRLKINSGRLVTLTDLCKFLNNCNKTKICQEEGTGWKTVKEKSIYIGFDVKKNGEGTTLTSQ